MHLFKRELQAKSIGVFKGSGISTLTGIDSISLDPTVLEKFYFTLIMVSTTGMADF